MIDNFVKDLRYSARLLFKNPGFTAVAVLSLALGIGVNTTIFTFVNALLLKPLPVEDLDQLVEVYLSERDSGYPYSTSSYPDYRDYRDQNDVFSGLVAHELTFFYLQPDDGPSELIFGEAVSGNYFDLLGVDAAIGRTFLPEEDSTPGTHPVVVLGHGFWERRLGADPEILGKTIKLNGQSITIVGVAPERFTGTFPVYAPDFWTPMAMQVLLNPGGPDPEVLGRRRNRGLFIKGRLETGVTIEQAEAQMNTILARLVEEYPDAYEDRRITLVPLSDVRLHPFVDGYIAPGAALLMGIVSLVLLIACANVANMLLSRASARRQEVAVRLALGAGRWRLVRQLLTESLLLALAGGALGLLLAQWATRLILTFQPPLPISVALDLGIDVRVLGFAFLVALLTGTAFGLAPALRASRPELVSALKDDTARGGVRFRRFGLRNFLVVSQVAVSLVLLIAAGLFLRSLSNAQQIDPGFETERVAILSPAADMLGYTDEQRRVLDDQAMERIRALPGVDAVGFATRLPVGISVQLNGFHIEGREPPAGQMNFSIDVTTVDAGFFEVFDIPLVAGRTFNDADTPEAPGVVIINETMARRFWPGENPIGKRINRGELDGPWHEVVGVVRDYKVRTVGEDYRPFVHYARSQRRGAFGAIVIRTTGDPAPMVTTARELIWEIDPNMVFFEAKTMKENLEITTFPVRLGAMLLGVFGFLALGLAAVGLYGVIAYIVSQRTHEIGLRMALGAETADVLKMVVGQGMVLVGVGVLFGLLVSAGLSWLLSSFLYGVSAVDPITFGLTAVVLSSVALVANYIPARRAARVDPMVSLRYE